MNRIVLISAIDNLIKGAAGQALQNANILLGKGDGTFNAAVTTTTSSHVAARSGPGHEVVCSGNRPNAVVRQ